MKFPVHSSYCGRHYPCAIVTDVNGNTICGAETKEITDQIADALTLQHNMAANEQVQAKKAGPDLGSTPARDSTYRQELTLCAIEGVSFDLMTNISGEAIAARIHAAVTELLRLEAEEES